MTKIKIRELKPKIKEIKKESSPLEQDLSSKEDLSTPVSSEISTSKTAVTPLIQGEREIPLEQNVREVPLEQNQAQRQQAQAPEAGRGPSGMVLYEVGRSMGGQAERLRYIPTTSSGSPEIVSQRRAPGRDFAMATPESTLPENLVRTQVRRMDSSQMLPQNDSPIEATKYDFNQATGGKTKKRYPWEV